MSKVGQALSSGVPLSYSLSYLDLDFSMIGTTDIRFSAGYLGGAPALRWLESLIKGHLHESLTLGPTS